jgi:Mor family transcriptional regulator
MDLKEEFEAAISAMSEADMPNDDMRGVAHECGVDVAVKLLRHHRGEYLCVPNQHPFGRVADRFVIDKFDGTNAKQLARATGYSLRHIYEIIEREDAARAGRKPKFAQGDLFEPTAAAAAASA